jgi:peptide/nickel transport system substrate-binding protein
MHKSLKFIKEFHIPKKKEFAKIINSFSKKELIIFSALVVVAITSAIILLAKVNSYFMVKVPTNGGSLTEGVIGIPTLINPVLAVSDADKDLTSIIYSGLVRKLPDGSYIPDLAESLPEISENELTYTFKIKDNATFHDGKKVTADDIIFTIEKIKDPLLKSPRRNGWDLVTVNKEDDRTVVFTLKQPYLSFMDNMTVGILPNHLWKNIGIQEFSLSPLNIKAIGSGPYKIESVIKNSDNIPEQYLLKEFKDFTLGNPHIKTFRIISYANEKELIKGLQSGEIDQASGISPKNAKNLEEEGYKIHTTTLSRIFGIFFNNTNNKILADQSVIEAINKALDREIIVNEVLNGYGTIINNPIPENIYHNEQDLSQYKNSNLEEARKILEKGGWKLADDGIMTKGGITTTTKTTRVKGKDVTKEVKVDSGPITKLTFSLTTGDSPELKSSSELIKNQLSLIGIDVETKVYEIGQLNQLIRSRNYEALFFGQVVNHESDLYSFWHSTQKSDPGLNIAMYNNKRVDLILESTQKIRKEEDRLSKYKEFIEEFNKSIPALLIYSPKYLYVTSEDLNNIYIDSLNSSSDRFVSIYDWYANQELVWKIFNK